MSFPRWGFQTAGQAQLHDDLYGTEYATGPRVIQDWDRESKWATRPQAISRPAPLPPMCRLEYVNCARCDTTGFDCCPTCMGRLYYADDPRPRCPTCQGGGRVTCTRCHGAGHIPKEA